MVVEILALYVISNNDLMFIKVQLFISGPCNIEKRYYE